ncbi:hypothetical protein RFI_01602 [Reticulomyxa filosa]|uniref:Arsenite methyltransferase n=1 Tax=Reticulomyxa filosa TaxID=46433 RepID=X6PAA8_RETFI|nr:hypothetical protein RFI_01602 [Reticulomyxa filosa]|eukprot:ETO35460.1 hypothetical protein RFI_01602 [Reticulomyxa filosa]
MSTHSLALISELIKIFCSQFKENLVFDSNMSTEAKESQKSDKDVHTIVADYYGKVLQSKKDLKTNACCTAGAPHPTIRQALKLVPDEIMEKYYGCGNPIPFGMKGLTVVDLGSGSGRDCYIASNLVGEKGKVIGVDMTDEQLQVARAHVEGYCKKTLGYQSINLEFRKGLIENLTDEEGANIKPDSVDIVISNCVVNLSPNKDQVLSSVWSILKTGGEFYFSDVYCDRRLPSHVRTHHVLLGECLGWTNKQFLFLFFITL